MTVEKMVALLRAGGFSCAHDAFTDSEGVGYLLSKSQSQLRAWRRARIGPPWMLIGRPRYDLEKLAEWLNAGGFAAKQQPGALK
jgi:hypothetical protein